MLRCGEEKCTCMNKHTPNLKLALSSVLKIDRNMQHEDKYKNGKVETNIPDYFDLAYCFLKVTN